MPSSGPTRRISIRWSIFLTLIILITLIAGSLFIITAMMAIGSVRKVTNRFVADAAEKTDLRLRAFFEPVMDDLQLLVQLTDSGRFNPRDRAEAIEFFRLMLERHPQLEAIYYGRAGNELLLLDREGTLAEIPADMALPGRRIRWDAASGETGPEETYRRFDPATRPWFQAAQAKEPGTVAWTEPYRFVSNNKIGITAAVRPRGTPDLVIAMDVTLTRLMDFLREARPTPGGRAFILGSTGAVITENYFGPAANLPAGQDSAPISEVLREASAESNVVRHGADWWCGFRPVRIPGGRDFRIGILIPHEDLLEESHKVRNAVLSVTLGAILVAVALTLTVAKGYSKPMKALVRHSEQIERLDTDDVIRVDTRIYEVARLADAQEKMRRALDSFAKYVPVNVVRDLLAQGAAAEIGGESRTITVMFSDIAGFTSMAENMTPEALTEHMGEYFDMMVRTLLDHDATIDKFIGDAIMAFWGAPRPMENHAGRACHAVLACQARLAEYNARWIAEGKAPLPTRIGIATGPATVGNVGAEFRLSYTALGDTVNLAQRLEKLNNLTKTWVLADEATRDAAGDGFDWRAIGSTPVKGREREVNVFELRPCQVSSSQLNQR